ncbi:MAG: hypothetical protein HQL38_04155 [Alphaproteobacteria bacterium]|nr:hypothetical protein [Alphaproteobacteria bacterium]
MTNSPYVLLGHLPLPMDVGELPELDAVADPEIVLHTVENGPVSFRFVYKDVPFAASYVDNGVQARFTMTGNVGPLPYSAENGMARAGVRAILESANRVLGPVFRLSPERRVQLCCDVAIERPVTAVIMVAAIARFLVPAAPYLDCIAAYRPTRAKRTGLSAR